MISQSSINELLHDIEPSKTTKATISRIHNSVREYLKNHDKYKNVYLGSFLSGSYAKSTAIRPSAYSGKGDVDIVVVINYNLDANSVDVFNELKDIQLEIVERNNTFYIRSNKNIKLLENSTYCFIQNAFVLTTRYCACAIHSKLKICNVA